jgi:hypothetical protein
MREFDARAKAAFATMKTNLCDYRSLYQADISGSFQLFAHMDEYVPVN